MDQAESLPHKTHSAIITQHQTTAEKGSTLLNDPIANSSYSINSVASAPPVEDNGIDNEALCSSPSDPVTHDPPPPYSTLREEQAREAILQFVSDHCCYGKKPAIEMIFRTLESSSAFHYTLQTFAEKRETKWKTVPYTGYRGNSNYGAEPSLWAISVPARPDYQEGKYKTEVPNTSSIKTCSSCSGTGKTTCSSCYGSGSRNCYSCHGSGRDGDDSSCSSCRGSGRDRCISCSGDGRVQCSTCSGYGQLRSYKQLKCKWQNHIDDQVVERTELPNKLIRKVNGEVVFEEDLPTVKPILGYADRDVAYASEELVKKHKQDHCENRIRRQRHSVRVIPVTQVQYEWKDKSEFFFIYGYENKVHCPSYPHKCCCGCSIL